MTLNVLFYKTLYTLAGFNLMPHKILSLKAETLPLDHTARAESEMCTF
jgi:hypothetical protein